MFCLAVKEALSGAKCMRMSALWFVLRFYGRVNPMGSFRAWSLYLTTCLLGRLSPLSGYCSHSFTRNWQPPFLNQRKGENDHRKYFMINLLCELEIYSNPGQATDFNSFPASGDFCRLLITFANSLDKMSGLIWIQTVWHSYGISEMFFKKVNLKRNPQRTKKRAKLPSIQWVDTSCSFACCSTFRKEN